MIDFTTTDRIRRKYLALSPVLDERARRHWAATEALELGWGGVSAVCQATGLSRVTITRGIREVQSPPTDEDVRPGSRVRKRGAGRKPLAQSDPDLLGALEALVEPLTRGDPLSPLRWTCKSTRRLAEELSGQRHPVSPRTVASLLKQAGYSLQANRKTREGKQHPDRNAQFDYLNGRVQRFVGRGQPAISVDTKKKENIGDFKNAGREWHRRGRPEEVRVHDFKDRELGKAIPYGVYDMLSNAGWVSVGVDHDTARFAAHSIGRWWREMGQQRFPRAKRLLITADGGGSNSYRNRLWKVSLGDLADELGLPLTVCHFPPGTSKWNKIEHRLFSYITMNWRGKPLVSRQAVVELISATTTREGLSVRAELDTNKYEVGVKVTDAELARVKITPHEFHGEWNYTIKPRK